MSVPRVVLLQVKDSSSLGAVPNSRKIICVAGTALGVNLYPLSLCYLAVGMFLSLEGTPILGILSLNLVSLHQGYPQ